MLMEPSKRTLSVGVQMVAGASASAEGSTHVHHNNHFLQRLVMEFSLRSLLDSSHSCNARVGVRLSRCHASRVSRSV